MGQLSLAVLGLPVIRHGDKVIRFPTRKVLALLLYLAVERGHHGRDQLVTLLWPDSNEASGRATLRSSLTRLRDALSGDTDREPHIIHERDLVGFNTHADYELDLEIVQAAVSRKSAASDGRAEVDELQRAAEVCRGEFLYGISMRDAPEFEAWVAFQRRRCEPIVENILDRLSQLQASEGNVGDALETANRWVALNHMSEPAYRRLMELHLGNNDGAAALRVYDRCRILLAEELGTAPQPETEAVAERVRGATRRRVATRFQPAISPPTPSLLEGPLVGRTAQFAKLVELYHRVRSAQPQVVVVQGESGIGKTRLAEEFLRWAAAQGADVLGGRAFETGGRLPYQPLVDGIRPRIECENAPEDLLSDVWLAELTRLLPELSERYPDLPVPAGDEAAARTRLFEAVARLGQSLAERAPLVLFIDDAQWADEASLDVLHYVVRRWTEAHAPILLLLCVRSEALGATPVLADWFVSLERAAACTGLALDALTAEDIVGFVSGLTSTTGDEGDLRLFAQWLHRETGGHALFVVEMLKALLERGALTHRLNDNGDWVLQLEPAARDAAAWHGFVPPGMREVIRARLRWLSPTAQSLATTAAVLGQSFTFEQLCRVADLVEGDALRALDEAIHGRLVREDAVGGYLFTHDKIREVAYADAGDARRRVFHRRAYDALRREGAPAARLVHHALAAGLVEAAFESSVAAGDHALRLLAAREAIAYYEQAMTLAQQLGRTDSLPRLYARRGQAFNSITRWPEARRDFEAAVAGLAVEERAATLVELAMVCHWLFDVPSTRRYAAAALEFGEALGRDDLVAGAVAALALADSSDGELASSLDRYRQAFVGAGALRPAALAPAAEMSGLILYWTGQYAEAIAQSQQAIEIARSVNDTSHMVRALGDLGMALGGSGRYREAFESFEQARRFGREYGIDTWAARAISMHGGLHLDLFDHEGAEALAEEARELGWSSNFLLPVVSGGIDLLLSLARRGEVGRTEQLIDEVAQAVHSASGAHGWLWRLRLAQARAEIALAAGDWDAAITWANDALEQSRARGRPRYETLALGVRGQAVARQGRAPAALADLRAGVQIARSSGDPALFVRAAGPLLAIEEDQRLFGECRVAAEQVWNNLADPVMRQRFAAAEPLQLARVHLWVR